ncbi:hypothetical protein [Cyanobium sp. ATX 6F1]|uniref:hypothetical protein n=1 Tax=unclassified Cyanobium TaxID=2627006 RepID=UPI0020CF777F|nr:hypothetical protein [Cyanobium sp. ATX 6F1]MCP9917194.1 hypothetical protein [Cyanobium sp. ATX 6F1]
MDPFQQRLAEQVKALSQVCETLLLRLLEAESRLVKLTILLDNDTMKGISDSAFQASETALNDADVIVESLASYLIFNDHESSVNLGASSQAEAPHRHLPGSKTIELSFESSEFIDDENQELGIDYEEVQDVSQDFLAA